MSTLEATTSDISEEGRLVAENVTTGYGTQEIIHDISMQSHDGVTCIFGPNGSGKSTMLKALNGMVPVWSGSVRYRDLDLTNMGADEIVKSGIITLPQDGGLFGKLTVRENLRLGGFTVDDGDLVRARIEEVLETFPALEEKFEAKAQTMSGGQQMMLSFGRAMVSGADIFMLDEPSAGLAPALVDDVIEQIQLLVENGVQVVLVEQNVRAALTIADHVYILAQGEMQFDGKPNALSEEDELIDLYLGID